MILSHFFNHCLHFHPVFNYLFLFLDSKKRKFENQKEREETTKLTKDVDAQWKDVYTNLKVTGAKIYNKKFYDEKDHDSEPDDGQAEYNKLMKELIFEPKKPAQERLKKDEEIVQEEKEKLEKLEEMRLKRMKGDDDEVEDEKDDEDENQDDGVEDEKDESESGEEEGEESEDDDQFSDLEESEDESETTVSKAK